MLRGFQGQLVPILAMHLSNELHPELMLQVWHALYFCWCAYAYVYVSPPQAAYTVVNIATGSEEHKNSIMSDAQLLDAVKGALACCLASFPSLSRHAQHFTCDTAGSLAAMYNSNAR